MQSGQTELDEDEKMPGVFCKYIHLNPSNFLPTSISQMKVLLSVPWNKTMYNSTIIEASASWSENVTSHGFKACVLVAGRHLNSEFKVLPSIHWIALNFHENYFDSSVNESGIARLPTWRTGTMCQSVLVKSRLDSSLRAIVSISHTKAQNYHNAMSVWADLTSSSLKVCSRELQNFDGIHEGVLVVS